MALSCWDRSDPDPGGEFYTARMVCQPAKRPFPVENVQREFARRRHGPLAPRKRADGFIHPTDPGLELLFERREPLGCPAAIRVDSPLRREAVMFTSSVSEEINQPRGNRFQREQVRFKSR